MDESFFQSSGNVIFADFHSARVFAKKLNDARDIVRFPEKAVKAGQLNALGLIDEIYHYILRVYEETSNPGVFERAYKHLGRTLGPENSQSTIESFVTLFPPLAVYKGSLTGKKYLQTSTAGRAHPQMATEELMLLYFTNFNPAAKKFDELFTDAELQKKTQYKSFIEELEKFFKTEKRFGPENQFIFDLLRAPILANPESLEAQLKFIKARWGMLLSQKFLDRILGSMDLLQEENKTAFGGPGMPAVPDYKGGGGAGSFSYGSFEGERFTTDLDWMPRVVLLAKNTYVWLDQLSKKYRRQIARLDQIPDEELDQLARWNFSGLWLIGLWERSNASRKIKQWTGNPEAVPSAYSLFEYEIARDLGGEDAFQDLNRRAWHRGIRLAGDMVPNHMGIYSKWVIEHPEYFIQSDYPPFPNYQFTGGDLSESPGIQLRIEDGYWSHKDAAVVFQRIDNRTGKISYIYHGNDGTNMPWNDTAQLDLLKSEVREAVIQTIFHVARKFSIIRFDAAMTLTKKHFQRLWYPQPGTGGDIPSRADHALSKEQFDKLFPEEFWREVVDRINQYMPSTLLLAEAFWLMEGYFVRTLGMHRVYNSAFMHMLMKEENEKYHLLITNTLEFNPEILKRYVNFMSNPDEQTAVAQFGKDDKYFGVAVMMVTLPGLPMFGHGQIEGFTEKYGMEYKRAYYDESQDDQLIRRHEHEIFPVMKKRHLFSDVTNFEFYDFHDSRGHVNYNVFAYSNVSGGERALIFYHNKYQESRGWIRWGNPKSHESGSGERINVTKSLGEALNIKSGDKDFYIFRDYKSNMEFIRAGKELHERGFYAELKAFEYQIFLDFKEIYDATGEYAQIAHRLHGRGVSSVDEAVTELRQMPIHECIKKIVTEKHAVALRAYCASQRRSKSVRESFEELVAEFAALEAETGRYFHRSVVVEDLNSQIYENVEKISAIWKYLKNAKKKTRGGKKTSRKNHGQSGTLFNNFDAPDHWAFLLSWLTADAISRVTTSPTSSVREIDCFTAANLEKQFQKLFAKLGRTNGQSRHDVSLLKLMTKHSSILSHIAANNRFTKIEQLFEDFEVREFIKVNLYQGTWYYHQESFEELVEWLVFTGEIQAWKVDGLSSKSNITGLKDGLHFVQEIRNFSSKSDYSVESLRALLSPTG
ncbi:MAG TPA: alpha-amylase family glycosyl hydrolase [Bacteroidota bacterium]|nr:alpha-amylase family glycosyl hydrolase [Bacteroidota bacterium]